MYILVARVCITADHDQNNYSSNYCILHQFVSTVTVNIVKQTKELHNLHLKEILQSLNTRDYCQEIFKFVSNNFFYSATEAAAFDPQLRSKVALIICPWNKISLLTFLSFIYSF